MEIQLVYLALMTLVFLNVHFFLLFRRQMRVFQSPWLATTSLALPDQGCLGTNHLFPGKTSADATLAGTWRGITAFPMAGSGKRPVCTGVGAGVSRDDLRATTNIPQGVTRGDIGESITGLSLGITDLLCLPLLGVSWVSP